VEYDANRRYGSVEEMKRALMSLSSTRGITGTTSFGTPAFISSDVVALWRFACEDEVRSSPAVHNGILYVGSYDHNLYAINAENGKFLWKYATEGVFVGSADRALYAINADTGRIFWTCPTQTLIRGASFGPVPLKGVCGHRPASPLITYSLAQTINTSMRPIYIAAVSPGCSTTL